MRKQLNSALATIGIVLALFCPGAAGANPSTAQGPATPAFKTPQAAVTALDTAVTNGNAGLQRLFGVQQSRDLMEGADPDAVRQSLGTIRALIHERWHTVRNADGSLMLRLGQEGWPFPVPLVQRREGWKFDTVAGIQEVRRRRIGRNELLNIESARQLVRAEKLYKASQKTYTDKLASTPGKKDGLYWKRSGNDISPLQQELADSADYVASRPQGRPWFGYHYRVLTAQGPHARGGAMSYLNAEGKLVAGFAAVAYPAAYGRTGVMTFMVSQDGKVYQKDLGPETTDAALSLQKFDPDKSWHLVND